MTHGLQGISTRVRFKASQALEFNLGGTIENALNLNFIPDAMDLDKPKTSLGKSNVFYGNGMLKVTRRSQGIDYFVGDEVFKVQDGIRNDVVKTVPAGDSETKNILADIALGGDVGQIDYKFQTDQLRYQNAIVNNFVAGLTYLNIPNFEYNIRMMVGLEAHMKISDSLYITKTRADYSYESFWESYGTRNIAKSFFVNKFGYLQQWNLEYEGWKSVFNILNRFEVIPQYKIGYELSRNLKERGEEKDPRKIPRFARPDRLLDDELAEYRNLWQEYDANTEDYVLSVPILRCNFKIAEKTRLETGVQWMRAFDRITEANSFYKNVKIAQIKTEDNYAGYNIALIIGVNSVTEQYDINLKDQYLGTGSSFNSHFSEVFAKIYAGQ
jgi:hypothetical protein